MNYSSETIMTITDPVHGSIPINPLQKALMETVEVQRLNSVHQLGMAYQVYPSAHAMRFSHVLGVSHLARLMGEQLILGSERIDVSENDRIRYVKELTAAGLLHDICHTPWSHTLEPLYLEMNQGTHMDAVKAILTGSQRMPLRGAGKIPEIFQHFEIDAEHVAALINKSYPGPKFVGQMIFGEVDADTLDYLRRDFHFTGVSFGHIDIHRLIQTMVVMPDRLCFLVKGLQAVRDFLNARVEMYSAVYLHKKTRISDSMFLKAARISILENREFPDFHVMTDDELLSGMMNSTSEYVRDIAWRLKYRQGLFKQVYHVESGALQERHRDFFLKILNNGESPKRLESFLCEKLDIPHGYLIVDMVGTVTDVSEQRFKDLDIVFVDKTGKRLTLRDLDAAFAEYIQQAKPSRSLISVYVSEEYVPRCEDRIQDIIHRFSE